MKILFVITKGNWGGAQKYVFEVATRLPREHFQAVVAYGEYDILPEKLKTAGIQSLKIPNLARDINILSDIKVFFSLITLFRKETPDVVHLNSSKIGALGALAARIARVKKIVFTVHGFAFNEDRSWWQKNILLCISWFTLFLSTDVIFISKKELAQASSWLFIKNKLHVIYSSIEVPVFLDKTTAQKKLDLPTISELTTVVMSIGELTKNKGYIYALEALKKLEYETILYIIIGAGEQEKELKEYVQENNLMNKVMFAGFVKNASEYIKAADIFLLPSLKEGLPYVLLEAGLAEVPVISTDVGGIPELITHTVSGILVPPKNPDEIRHALETMIHKPVKKYFTDKLCEKISSTFTLEHMMHHTIDIYTQKN